MQFKLQPEQISYYWDMIKESIEASSPGVTQQGTNVILENLLTDHMQCWLVLEKENGEFLLQAIILTGLFRDNFFQRHYLRVCSLYSLVPLSSKQWQEGMLMLQDFAREKGCCYLEAFTEHEAVARRAIQQSGGRMNYHILVEVGE